jgi:hypothetical protein
MGGHHSEVKEEGPHGPGDTNSGAHPCLDAGERKRPIPSLHAKTWHPDLATIRT